MARSKKQEKPRPSDGAEEKDASERSDGADATHGTAGGRVLKTKYINKQRVLVFCSRGINYRARHLMTDMRSLMPHSKADVKLDKKDNLHVVNEVCELKSCNGCVFFEMRKRQDLYLWVSRTPHGPSAKFHVENIHTMDELKLTGNCLKGSRPILSFDAAFDAEPHLALLKEMFIQVFGTPRGHPKSKPFFDHVISFTLADGRVWFRNYQIVETTGEHGKTETSLAEVGPRFALNPIRIFGGSFGGATLYENPSYVSPNEYRLLVKSRLETKYKNRSVAAELTRMRKEAAKLPESELDTVFEAQD